MSANELFVIVAHTYGLHLVLVAVLLAVLCLVRHSIRRSKPGPATCLHRQACRTCGVATGYRRSRRAHRLFRVGRWAVAQRDLW